VIFDESVDEYVRLTAARSLERTGALDDATQRWLDAHRDY
jgi:hypothetical protein